MHFCNFVKPIIARSLPYYQQSSDSVRSADVPARDVYTPAIGGPRVSCRRGLGDLAARMRAWPLVLLATAAGRVSPHGQLAGFPTAKASFSTAPRTTNTIDNIKVLN